MKAAMGGMILSNGHLGALATLMNRIGCKDKEVQARSVLRDPSDEDGSDLILIQSGLAWVYKIASDGELQVVALRFPGEPVLPCELHSGFGVQALVESKVAVVEDRELPSLVDAVSSELLREIAERHLRIALGWLVRGSLDAAGKIAHLLCEIAVRSGQALNSNEPVAVPLTQYQIAVITGQTGVNVNRVLASWQRQGIIQRTGRQYIADWAALGRIGRFDPDYLH